MNYANDYSDGIRGTDDHRVGPARLTASRKVKPRAVLIVALIFFAIAAVAGPRDRRSARSSGGCSRSAPSASSPPGSTPAASARTATTGSASSSSSSSSGSSRPLGTTWVQALALPQEAWFGAVGAGLLACAVLLANNLRDIDQDRKARQAHADGADRPHGDALAVHGVRARARSRIACFLALFYPIAWLTLLALLAALPAILIVWTYRDPRELVVALGLTSLTSVAYGAFLFWAFIG